MQSAEVAGAPARRATPLPSELNEWLFGELWGGAKGWEKSQGCTLVYREVLLAARMQLELIPSSRISLLLGTSQSQYCSCCHWITGFDHLWISSGQCEGSAAGQKVCSEPGCSLKLAKGQNVSDPPVRRYSSVLDCVQRTFRDEGMGGFFRGVCCLPGY